MPPRRRMSPRRRPPPAPPPAPRHRRSASTRGPSNTTCLAGDPPSSAVSLAVQRVFAEPAEFHAAHRHAAGARAIPRAGTWCRRPARCACSTTRRMFRRRANSSIISSRLNSDPSRSERRARPARHGIPSELPDRSARVPLLHRQPIRRWAWWIASRNSARWTTARRSSPGTELVLFNVDDPENNHNGGNIAFGPDGFLYIGIGDGGGGGDAHGTIGNGQRLTTLLGKMLRIDVVGLDAAADLRDPAEQSVRRQRALQRQRQRARPTAPRSTPTASAIPGAGASIAAAASCGSTTSARARWRKSTRSRSAATTAGAASKAPTPSTRPAAPIAKRDRRRSRSTAARWASRPPAASCTAAAPSRACRAATCSAISAAAISGTSRATRTPTLHAGRRRLSTGLQIASFGAGHRRRAVHRPSRRHAAQASCRAAAAGRTIPDAALRDRLRELQPIPRSRPAASFPTRPTRRSSPTAPSKTRWLALPDGQRITVGDQQRFRFPQWQRADEELQSRRPAGRDAPVHAPQRRQLGRLHLRVERAAAPTPRAWSAARPCRSAARPGSSRAKRNACSAIRSAAGRTLGLEIGQLNGDFGYPTGRTANQLTTLNAIDTLTPALTQPPAQLPVIPDPYGSAPLGAARARLSTYELRQLPPARRPRAVGHGFPLHHGAESDQRLRHHADARAISASPIARLIAPGSAARSVVVARVNRTGTDAMPPLARHTIDTAGVQLLTDWINGLTSCN